MQIGDWVEIRENSIDYPRVKKGFIGRIVNTPLNTGEWPIELILFTDGEGLNSLHGMLPSENGYWVRENLLRVTDFTELQKERFTKNFCSDIRSKNTR